MALVISELHGPVAVITLNRPEAMNALSQALRRDLADAVTAAASDPSVRAVVLTGSGERAFCAGLDLKEIGVAGLSAHSGDTDPVAALNACRAPVIAAVNGVAVTGGFEIMLACDFAIAATGARFADTHVRMGVVPGWGLSQRLSRTVGLARAKEMSLTGRYIDAQTALAWGLVNRVVPPEALMGAALEQAQAIAALDPGMVGAYKRLIEDGFELPLADALALERRRATEANAALRPGDLGRNAAETLRQGRASRT